MSPARRASAVSKGMSACATPARARPREGRQAEFAASRTARSSRRRAPAGPRRSGRYGRAARSAAFSADDVKRRRAGRVRAGAARGWAEARAAREVFAEMGGQVFQPPRLSLTRAQTLREARQDGADRERSGGTVVVPIHRGPSPRPIATSARRAVRGRRREGPPRRHPAAIAPPPSTTIDSFAGAARRSRVSPPRCSCGSAARVDAVARVNARPAARRGEAERRFAPPTRLSSKPRRRQPLDQRADGSSPSRPGSAYCRAPVTSRKPLPRRGRRRRWRGPARRSARRRADASAPAGRRRSAWGAACRGTSRAASRRRRAVIRRPPAKDPVRRGAPRPS